MNPTPERRAEFVAALRNLAGMIENTTLPLPYNFEAMVLSGSLRDSRGVEHSIDTPVGLALAASKMGRAEKDADDNFFTLKRDFGAGVSYKVYASRKGVCEQVKVGTKVIAAQPERVVPASVIAAQPERVEDVYEWQCPSLLKAGSSVSTSTTSELPSPEPVLALAGGGSEEDIPF